MQQPARQAEDVASRWARNSIPSAHPESKELGPAEALPPIDGPRSIELTLSFLRRAYCVVGMDRRVITMVTWKNIIRLGHFTDRCRMHEQTELG